MKRLLISAALCVSAAAATPTDLSNLSDEERAAFGAEIRTYLLQNPQVLVEAMQAYEAEQQAMQARADLSLVAAHADDLFDDGHSWVGGNPDGDITIVEFMDYRCGFCKRAAPEVASLLSSDPNIRLIVKEFPILGPGSERASRFAIATHALAGDRAYKTVHDQLIRLRSDVSDTVLERIASEAGLSFSAITAEMGSDATTKVISRNRQLAQRLSITGTPTFVIGGQLLRGFLPAAGMEEIIARERTEG
ncbi:MAG: DsbA family protein [Pseudomonadota bacterium]